MNPRIKRLYWQLTTLPLTAHFAGWAHAVPLAIGLTTWQAVHVSRMRRTQWSLDVQVRTAYAGLLVNVVCKALFTAPAPVAIHGMTNLQTAHAPG